MKRLVILATLLFTSTSLAQPFAAPPDAPVAPAMPEAPTVDASEALVHATLLEPLAAKEEGAGRFSRRRLPSQERRVRVLDARPRLDTAGGRFIRFAVDARHDRFDSVDESSWEMATITGCVYLERNQVFIKKKDQYRPAAFLLGKNVKAAAAATCKDDPRLARAD